MIGIVEYAHKMFEKAENNTAKHRTSKKLLTIKNKSGSIIKLSARETPKDREEYEELQKSLKKHLTKSKRCDII